MKLSVAIAGINAPPSAFVVWRGFEESIENAAEAGFHGVELALKSADEVDPKLLTTWLERRGMEISCISTGQAFAVSHLSFTHPDQSVRDETYSVFCDFIDLAADFGGMVNIGRVRGSYRDDQVHEETETVFVDMARRICDYGLEKGVTLILEPVNRYEINFINTLEEGAVLVSRVDRTNIGLMPDVFHMNIEDPSISGALINHASLIKYIHLADSNRHAPGQGHIDFDEVFRGLSLSGFDGWASIEILPYPDPNSAALTAANFILPRIANYSISCDALLDTSQ